MVLIYKSLQEPVTKSPDPPSKSPRHESAPLLSPKSAWAKRFGSGFIVFTVFKDNLGLRVNIIIWGLGNLRFADLGFWHSWGQGVEKLVDPAGLLWRR